LCYHCFFVIIVDGGDFDETESVPFRIILLTKLGIIKWKRRICVETFVFGNEKYKTKFRGKTYKMGVDNLILIKRNSKKRYNKTDKLIKYLDNLECETYIPQFVLDTPKTWDKEKMNIIREHKLKRILESE
jgi:hypothetical protein